MIIRINTEKAFDKNLYPFMIKVLKKHKIKETYENIIKPISAGNVASIMLENINNSIGKVFVLKSGI